MRRVLLFVLVVALSVVLASAATLEVDGGVLQVFRIGVEVEAPVNTESSTDATVSPPTSVTTSTLHPGEETTTSVDKGIP